MARTSVINVPSVGKAAKAPERFVQVLIDKDEKLPVKEGTTKRTATLTSVADQVKGLIQDTGLPNTEVPVIIAADKTVKYEVVVKVMDTLQRNGVQRVGLSVQTTP